MDVGQGIEGGVGGRRIPRLIWKILRLRHLLRPAPPAGAQVCGARHPPRPCTHHAGTLR